MDILKHSWLGKIVLKWRGNFPENMDIHRTESELFNNLATIVKQNVTEFFSSVSVLSYTLPCNKGVNAFYTPSHEFEIRRKSRHDNSQQFAFHALKFSAELRRSKIRKKTSSSVLKSRTHPRSNHRLFLACSAIRTSSPSRRNDARCSSVQKSDG